MAAAGKVAGARAVVVTVEVLSAELEARPAEAAVKAAISVPYLARMVAGTAWADTVAAVEARRAPRSALPVARFGIATKKLGALSWHKSSGNGAVVPLVQRWLRPRVVLPPVNGHRRGALLRRTIAPRSTAVPFRLRPEDATGADRLALEPH